MKPANHVTNLKCFPQVAAVIGHAKAQHELFLVALSFKNWVNTAFTLDDLMCKEDVLTAFPWGDAPQYGDFWFKVSEGKNPYKANA